MKIDTARFGTVEIEPSDLLQFPSGLLGLRMSVANGCCSPTSKTTRLGWLQFTSRPEIAFVVVCPRRFVPDYQVRIPEEN